ncbi:HypC/HybG/HupF family hydrogenase formation chaperone [uncultured Dialister sp.]|jgi:hydrogenase expression/formation protein HypC|uniref:HypC/HybG/HupF family hydrogenase formation chaperone n=1 Tax=Dialister sp. TaxID=1955814 RepID=UPI0025D3217A|nr:HypC/HybG/HupF family hydrogenase formation chaperone [uncultured Dialister sp.]
MCVAYPGRVVSISGTHGMVDFSGTQVPVNLAMVPVKIGDYVLVHAGMAIQIVEKKEARDWISLFKEIEETEKE